MDEKQILELQTELEAAKKAKDELDIMYKDSQLKIEELTKENEKLTKISKELLVKNSERVLETEKSEVNTETKDEVDSVIEKINKRFGDSDEKEK